MKNETNYGFLIQDVKSNVEGVKKIELFKPSSSLFASRKTLTSSLFFPDNLYMGFKSVNGENATWGENQAADSLGLIKALWAEEIFVVTYDQRADTPLISDQDETPEQEERRHNAQTKKAHEQKYIPLLRDSVQIIKTKYLQRYKDDNYLNVVDLLEAQLGSLSNAAPEGYFFCHENEKRQIKKSLGHYYVLQPMG